MSFRDDIAGVLEDLQGQLVNSSNLATFTWKNSVEIPCVAGQISRSVILLPGGHEAEVTGAINVRRDQFASADSSVITMDSDLTLMDNNRPHPVAGRTLIYNGKTYKVLSVARDPSGAYYRLELGDKNSGR